VIEVTKESAEMSVLPLELCCLCWQPTPYWYMPKDVACCQTCAEVATPDDIPEKKEWCTNARKRMKKEGT
jgi:predicted amidophosphoribosyltransferase